MAEIDMKMLLEQRREELNVAMRLLYEIKAQAGFEVQWERVLLERRQVIDRAIDAVRDFQK